MPLPFSSSFPFFPFFPALNSCLKMLSHWSVRCLPLDVKVCGGLSLFCFSFPSFPFFPLALKGYAIGQWGFILGCKSAWGVVSFLFLFSFFFLALDSCLKMLSHWSVRCLPLGVKVHWGLSLFRFSFRSFFSLLTLALKCYPIGQ